MHNNSCVISRVIDLIDKRTAHIPELHFRVPPTKIPSVTPDLHARSGTSLWLGEGRNGGKKSAYHRDNPQVGLSEVLSLVTLPAYQKTRQVQ
ncbi:hypothetical protein J6590_012173 [Homalodisca vitripennis]|nr:hypothetical protein J6590_012173 [Homalodisca vitripennis]